MDTERESNVLTPAKDFEHREAEFQRLEAMELIREPFYC